MTSTSTVPSAGASRNQQMQQFLTFRLGQEEFGIEILYVQEIKGFTPVTPLPNLPPHFRGVINLRGAVIPIVDLRLRFGMPQREYDKFTVVVVVRVGEKSTGLILDAVADVVDLTWDAIKGSKDLPNQDQMDFIHGVAQVEDRLVVLLNIGKLLAADNPSLDELEPTLGA